jgi:hypothetical protein
MLAILLGAGCVDEPEVVNVSRTLGEVARVPVIDEMTTDPEPDVCDLLPEDAGVCSVACDWEAVIEYVPVGTCAAFVCELVDGRDLTFHACHPEG